MRKIVWTVMLATLLLFGCGGGGSNSGTNPGNIPGGTTGGGTTGGGTTGGGTTGGGTTGGGTTGGGTTGGGTTVGGGGQTTIPPTAPAVRYPSRNLPTKFVAVTAFTTGAYSNSQQRLAYVKSVADLAKVRGVDVVNLAVDWNDVEPSKGTIDPLLETMIWEIKSRGLLCVLRVYANVQGLWQAWPIWLNSVETYPVAGKKEIFPWDNTYQSVWSEFQGQLASKFASWNAQPDGVQITIGGSFGEQVLGDYDSSKWPWPTFTDKLFAAEKWHVDTYIATMGSVAKDHIAVLNSLASSNPAYEDQVGVYARNKGVGWIESNAGACFLSEKPYGPDNAKMLARFQGGGARIFLEDESGKWSCPEVGLGASLSGRVALMKTLQSKYSINFSAVSISGDNDIYDVVGIANLKAMLGI